MSAKKVTLVVVLAGILIGLPSILADALGIGSGPGFGRYQLTGVIVAVLLLAYAFHRSRG
jgi:hypothetical protein